MPDIARFPGDHLFHFGIGFCGHADGINAAFRNRRVGCLSDEAYGSGDAGGLIISGMNADEARVKAVVAMGGNDEIHAVHNAVVHHHLCAAYGPFFAGLEDQPYTEPEFIFMFFQIFCHGKQDCRVGVVSAGVHFSRHSGCIGKIRLFLYGQGIHVGTQGNAYFSPADVGGKAARSVFFRVFNAHAAKLSGYQRSRSRKIEAHFRIFVQLPADADGILIKLFKPV